MCPNIYKLRETFVNLYKNYIAEDSTIYYPTIYTWGTLKSRIDEFVQDHGIFKLVKGCLIAIEEGRASELFGVNSTLEILNSILDVVERKNHDYGCSVFRKPVCAESVSVEDAIKVRLSDKFNRFETLYTGELEKIEESITDTVFDMVGYLFLLWCWIHK